MDKILYLYDWDPTSVGQSIIVLRLRDAKQTVEVEIGGDHRPTLDLIEAFKAAGSPVGPSDFTVSYEPWQVLRTRKLDWTSYRRGMAAQND